MNSQKENIKVIIGGGGTGGHIFPAVAIANQLKETNKKTDILFVGALGRMEMERIPEAGYKIIGLPVSGFDRKNIFRNYKVIMDLWKSTKLAKSIINEFDPDVVVGVGGYASGPVLRMASKTGIPTLIQEQNSYAGITNKILSKRVNTICVAYDHMDRFFPKDKIIKTGNPVRENLKTSEKQKKQGYRYFKIKGDKPVLLVLGGSLGARTINESIIKHIQLIIRSKTEVIWQCGRLYYDESLKACKSQNAENIRLYDFIDRMDYAYAVSDLIISRAGAISISEICLVRKPSILVPSPNVAEDHQTKNAMYMVSHNAAKMISDSDARERLLDNAISLLNDEKTRKNIAKNCAKLALPDATKEIVNQIYKLITN